MEVVETVWRDCGLTDLLLSPEWGSWQPWGLAVSPSLPFSLTTICLTSLRALQLDTGLQRGKYELWKETLFFLLDSMAKMQKERIEGNSYLFSSAFLVGKAFSNATNYGCSPSWCTGEVLLYNLCPNVITQSCPNLWHNTEISGQPKGSGANITLGAPLKVQTDLGEWPEGGCHPLFLPLQTRFSYC